MPSRPASQPVDRDQATDCQRAPAAVAGIRTASRSRGDQAGIDLAGRERRDAPAARARKAALVFTGQHSTCSSSRRPAASIASPRCAPCDDQLGDHRIVIGRDRRRLPRRRCRRAPRLHAAEMRNGRARPVEGRKPCDRILRIEPRLHRPAVDRKLVLPLRQRLAATPPAAAIRPDPAPVISSVTGCSTWSRVFISMNQMRSARRPSRRVGDELDRARADIVDRLRRLDRRLAHRRARRLVHARRRRLLDHLLVAALQRAVALEQVDDIAVRVAEHLHLDMARALDIFLDQHAVVAERGRPPRACS